MSSVLKSENINIKLNKKNKRVKGDVVNMKF